ncbi:MAG: hypothetical protein ABI723_20870 [Bacteroidia bacterium]
MDNIYLVNYSPIRTKRHKLIDLLNKGLSRYGFKIVLQPNPKIDMSTVEQRINMFHLLESALTWGVEGEVVEFGCYAGQSAMLFQKVIMHFDKHKTIYLYDSFEATFGRPRDVEAELRNNFSHALLHNPVVIRGKLEDTVPLNLPEKISFAHIDCGIGIDQFIHKNLIIHLVNNVYHRMSTGAVCMFMDYYDKSKGHHGRDFNPGVKPACDEFFADKPEKVSALYGNQYSHGYFRKL